MPCPTRDEVVRAGARVIAWHCVLYEAGLVTTRPSELNICSSVSLLIQTHVKNIYFVPSRTKEQYLTRGTVVLFWRARKPMEGKTKIMVWKTGLWGSGLTESNSNRIAEGKQLAWKTAGIVEDEQRHNRKHTGNSFSTPFEFFHIHIRKAKRKHQCGVISAKALKKSFFLKKINQNYLTKVQKEHSWFLSSWCCGPHIHPSFLFLEVIQNTGWRRGNSAFIGVFPKETNSRDY